MTHDVRFADTGYWLALTNTRDWLHRRALSLEKRLPGPIVTTEAVLLEVGNALANRLRRRLGVALINRLRTDRDIEVVPLGPELFSSALDLYSSHLDKEWSLTNCGLP